MEEESMDQTKLYIPAYVKAEAEYFSGFGKKELQTSVFMGIFVIFFSVIVWIFLADMAAVVLLIIVGGSAVIIINTKNEANLSVVSFVGLMMRYLKEQQRYRYRYLDEWK